MRDAGTGSAGTVHTPMLEQPHGEVGRRHGAWWSPAGPSRAGLATDA